MIKDDRVISDCCGQLDEEATAELTRLRQALYAEEAKNEELTVNYETAKDLLIGKARQNKALQSQQAKDPKAHPHYRVAMRVLTEWKRLCAPRAKELNGPRLKNVLARMDHGYTEDDLMKCVRGYARYPFVVDGRRVPVGPADKRYVDAELIFRDAKRVDAGIAMDENGGAGGSQRRPDMGLPPSVLGALDWRTVQRANYKMLKAALTREFGSGLLEDGYMVPFLAFPCPRCHPEAAASNKRTAIEDALATTPLTLELHDPGGTYLVRCSQCGLDEGLLLRALKDPVGLAVV